MKEVDAYKLFADTPGIIHSIDYAIASERGGGEASKTVYVLLPYYRRGNLQDLINANLVNHTKFPEKRLMQLFLGVCKALREMHVYTGGGGGGGGGPGGTGGERMEMRVNGVDENVVASKGIRKNKGRAEDRSGADEDDETEQQRPLMGGQEGVPSGEVKSYSHRDIKPGKGSHRMGQPSGRAKIAERETSRLTSFWRRQHHDRRLGLGAHPHGPRFHRRLADPNHLALPGHRHPRHGRRAQHDAVPGPRTL